MITFHFRALVLLGLFLVPGLAAPGQSQHEKRSTICRSILVQPDDSCDSVAARCGITTADLTAFNGSPSLCSSLPVGKPVCCSAEGGLTIPPIPSDNGLCYSYVIQKGDTCESMAGGYGITIDQLQSYNSRTWKWNGCQELTRGGFICLSSGEPPMPVALPNAVCGPQVPGAMRPKDWSEISSVSPCPPGECCSLYSGQCGKGTDFCEFATKYGGVKTTETKITETSTAETTTTETTTAETKAPETKTAEVLPSVIPVPPPPGLIESTASFEESLIVRSTETDLSTRPTEATTHVASVQTSNTWLIAAYDDYGCEGDYFVVQGHNENEGECLPFKEEFPTDDINGNPWCRWYTDGGTSSQNCSSASKTPKSWVVQDGLCGVFTSENCQTPDPYALTYTSKHGCVDIESVVNMVNINWSAVRCKYLN